jgi:hypothetical protein
VTLPTRHKKIGDACEHHKNYPNDVQASTMSMEEFMEIEKTLMEKNEDNMGKIRLLEVDDNIVL